MDRTIIGSNRISSMILPSRANALAACRAAVDLGPVLITGATGVGKSWLTRQLTSEGGSRAWVTVDCAPEMNIEDFLIAFADAIGITLAERTVGATRLSVYGALRLARQDARPMGLVFDEAHLASDAVLEEVRILANGVDRGDGLSALVICGQTPLARRLDSKRLEALESRLAARIHLLPLDLSETGILFDNTRPELAHDRGALEAAHRDSAGNPARLLRILGRLASASALAAPAENPPETHEPSELIGPLVPTKPPLRVEDGLIEVGWDADADSDSDGDLVTTESAPKVQTSSEDLINDEEEPIEDHYAALQAWDEWARNQGRVDAEREQAAMGEGRPSELDRDEAGSRTAISGTPGTWAEGRHGFGPYSQLFSRLKPLQGAE